MILNFKQPGKDVLVVKISPKNNDEVIKENGTKSNQRTNDR